MTIAALILLAIAITAAQRGNEADRRDYDRQTDNRPLLLHIRQDLKLIAFLLAAIAILIGLSADGAAVRLSGWLGGL